MADRTTPYPAFNFTVSFDGTDLFGGFSDVSGIMTEITVAEYRAGTDPENHVRKIQGVHKVGDVTLKRGVINSALVWQWIDDARVLGPTAKKTVVIALLSENRTPVQKWTLRGTFPLKWTGPTFAGKGGGDVAMEEIVLSCEALDYTPV
jgi:phage tail-like protein